MKKEKKYINALSSQIKVLILFLLAFFIYLSTGIKTVNYNEKAFVVTFNSINNRKSTPYLDTGVYWILPYPFSRIIKYNTETLNQIPIGFTTLNKYYKYLDNKQISYIGWETLHHKEFTNITSSQLIITGDENIIDFKGSIDYYITDPIHYYLTSIQPKKIILSIVNSQITQIINKNNHNDILLYGNTDFLEILIKNINKKLEDIKLGISLKSISIFDIHPPVAVVNSFRNVANARELKQKAIYIANRYYNQSLPIARGIASTMIARAESDAFKKTTELFGDAYRMRLITYEYNKNPTLHKNNIYFDKMIQILSKKKLYVLDKNKGNIIDYRFSQ